MLLNCYAKLKDTEKLETFIKSGTHFDLETAISMCRQGGYYNQAVFLAKKSGEHDLVIDILIEDSKKYDDALDYIWRLEPDIAYPNLMRYARVLLEHCPKDATQIFIDYYTGEYRVKQDAPVPAQPVSRGVAAGAVQNLASFIPLPYRQSPGMISPAATGGQQEGSLDADLATAGALGPPAEYDIPKPRTAFSSFADHVDEFVVFLEACLNQENIDDSDRADLHTSLFEIYLEIGNSKKDPEKTRWEDKARKLISDDKVRISLMGLYYSYANLSNIDIY